MKTALVTGGAGFLGSHLTRILLLRGYKVTVLDDLSTGTLENLASFESPDLNFIHEDVRNSFNFKCDVIFNLACPASPIHYQFDPVKTIETNVLGMRNVLSLAHLNNSIVIQASTSEVYGDPLISPQNEEYWGNVNPIGKRSCYDEGKRAAETLCFDYMRQHNTDVRVIRIFNTYGTQMQVNDGRVVSNFIVQALENKPITIYGKGDQTRSFCYVDDLISGFVKLLEHKKRPATPINLGNPKEITLLDLANRIKVLTNSKSPLEFKALPEDDPRQRKPDISKANELLAWYPTTDLQDGLKKTINYFKEYLS